MSSAFSPLWGVKWSIPGTIPALGDFQYEAGFPTAEERNAYAAELVWRGIIVERIDP
jgi:hypothetical protein